MHSDLLKSICLNVIQHWPCILNKALWAVRLKVKLKSRVALLTPFIGYVFHPSSPSTDVVSSSTTEMGKRGKGENTTIRNLSTRKKSYFHTGDWNISHKRVHLDIFYINRNDFLGWIFMSVAAYTVGATFLPLATQFGDWWIAVRLLSTVCSLPSHLFLSTTALLQSHSQQDTLLLPMNRLFMKHNQG